MPLSNPADFQFSHEEPFYGRLFTRRSDLTNEIRLLTPGSECSAGLLQNKETIHCRPAGSNGAGRHALMRYANAMADGNITWMTDGSHGQVVGQPSLPASSLPSIALCLKSA